MQAQSQSLATAHSFPVFLKLIQDSIQVLIVGTSGLALAFERLDFVLGVLQREVTLSLKAGCRRRLASPWPLALLSSAA